MLCDTDLLGHLCDIYLKVPSTGIGTKVLQLELITIIYVFIYLWDLGPGWATALIETQTELEFIVENLFARNHRGDVFIDGGEYIEYSQYLTYFTGKTKKWIKLISI